MEPSIQIGILDVKSISDSSTVSLGKGYVQHRNVSKENSSSEIVGDGVSNQTAGSIRIKDNDWIDNASWSGE